MLRLLFQLAALLLCVAGLSPKTVRQSPAQLVSVRGEEVVLSCSHSNSDFYMIQWYKQPARTSEMSLIGFVRYDTQTVEGPFQKLYNVSGDGRSLSSLSFFAVNEGHGSVVYFCAASDDRGFSEAYFGSGTKLTVLEPNRTPEGPTVTVFEPSEKECQNGKTKENNKTLLCVASDFYPDHVSVSWQINGVDIKDGIATDHRAKYNGSHYRITSRLRVSFSRWFTPGKNFTCTVSFFDGNDTVPHVGWVTGTSGPMRAKYMKTTNNAKLSYVVLIIKSSIYGLFVVFLVWKFQTFPGKQKN